MKNICTILKSVIIIVIAYSLSGCVMPQLSPTLAVPPLPAEPTHILTEANIPEPTSTRFPSSTLFPITNSHWQQVWADEFNSVEIDRSMWSFDTGPINDNVNDYTDSPENTKVVDGKLQIIALKESYNGFNYSAARLKTKYSVNWRYGRMEARIKLPASNGFVPAFWMLPADDLHGWWPVGGEIDILEHPTNLVDKIYGTVHTGAFNSFTGSAPQGGTIQIPDAETAFHVYAVEWTPDKIDFYVDSKNYFTFHNDHSGFEAWPFDQSFYLLLGIGVGGGWVGNPDSTSVFPAVMEVDYVRVYQELNDVSIYGSDYLAENSKAVSYSAPALEGAQYTWSVPEGAHIISGQNTPQIEVDWSNTGGNIKLELTTTNGSVNINYPVEVSTNNIKNGGFEKGVKYWKKTEAFPAKADFILTSKDGRDDIYFLFVDVKKTGVNPWDAQLSQENINLKSGNQYRVSFWAKAEVANSKINAAVINSKDFTEYINKTISLSNNWMQYEMTFSVPSDVTASITIDIGGHTGRYSFDNFVLASK